MAGDWGAWLGLLVFLCFCTLAELKRSELDVGHRRSESEWDNIKLQEIIYKRNINFNQLNPDCKIVAYGKHPWIIRFKFNIKDPITQNNSTLLMGALITPSKILTTNAKQAWFQLPLKEKGKLEYGSLWMYGYNYKDGCTQGRFAKYAVWHPRDANKVDILGLLGDFGLWTPYDPFEVEGEPFLTLKSQSLPKVEDSIKMLIEKPANLLMFLLKTSKDDGGALLNDEGSEFTFIGLPTCKTLPNFKAQKQVRFDKDATDASFFCGNGIPGSWNESSNDTYEGRGEDGAAGAVALYNDSGELLPLGLYDHWIGGNGEPRFFAAFTNVFFDWFDQHTGNDDGSIPTSGPQIDSTSPSKVPEEPTKVKSSKPRTGATPTETTNAHAAASTINCRHVHTTQSIIIVAIAYLFYTSSNVSYEYS